MKFEHFALNVEQPIAMSDWYEKHLGLKVVRRMEKAPFTTFLADDSGTILLELYHNPNVPVVDFRNLHPHVVHLAFVSADPYQDMEGLLEAGAETALDEHFQDGSHLLMLRDPWGLSFQLCKRAQPMLKDQQEEVGQ